MRLPFSIDQFLDVFGRYNSDIWPMQLVFYAFAGIALVVLFVNHSKKEKVINSVLSFFWIWMGFVYHILYFSEINTAAIFFGSVFVIQGLIFAYYGIYRSEIRYRYDKTIYSSIGTILVLYSLIIYPLLSYSLGHAYPTMPTFGLPCPTTIFTLGILLFSINRLLWYVYLIPLLWSVVGVSAAINLSITEDFSLGIAGAIALVAFAVKTKSGNKTSLAKSNQAPI